MINITQYDILEYLSKTNVPLSVRDISEQLDKKEASINKAVNQLCKYGLIRIIFAKTKCKNNGMRIIKLCKINPKINRKYYNNSNT